jgi:hypothetical protein
VSAAGAAATAASRCLNVHAVCGRPNPQPPTHSHPPTPAADARVGHWPHKELMAEVVAAAHHKDLVGELKAVSSAAGGGPQVRRQGAGERGLGEKEMVSSTAKYGRSGRSRSATRGRGVGRGRGGAECWSQWVRLHPAPAAQPSIHYTLDHVHTFLRTPRSVLSSPTPELTPEHPPPPPTHPPNPPHTRPRVRTWRGPPPAAPWPPSCAT